MKHSKNKAVIRSVLPLSFAKKENENIVLSPKLPNMLTSPVFPQARQISDGLNVRSNLGGLHLVMKKFSFLCLFHFVIAIGLFAQSVQTPTIIPASPESRSLGKYGDIPVSLYTGTPDISIPIHTVTIGKLSLPITLSYHAAGIEVSQEATWVGLGWNLIAGGNIFYIPSRGYDSNPAAHKLDWNTYKNVLSYMGNSTSPSGKHEDWYVKWSCYPEKSSPQIITEEVIDALLAGVEDQDVYSANFLNYSFKFTKHPKNDSIVFVGQKNKCKITGNVTNGFVITGEDGTIYRFEQGESSSGYCTSLVLTNITSSTGDEISLKYKYISPVNLPPLSETCILQQGVRTPSRNFSLVWEPHNVYLETIETRNELVIFESNTDRVDFKGGVKLAKITVKDKTSQTEKMAYRFAYDYFRGSGNGGDYLDDGVPYYYPNMYTLDNKSKRLKLDSLIQYSSSMTNEKYAFNYYESIPLPYKTSFALDHWGYYNGQNNWSTTIMTSSDSHHTIIPNLAPLLIANYSILNNEYPSNLIFFDGAVRGASKEYITTGMLKSIQYPTKGKTMFEYEPHDFHNYRYLSAEDEHDCIITSGANVHASYNSAYNSTESTFTLTHRICAYFKGNADANFKDGKFTIEAVSVPGGFSTKMYQYTSQTATDGRIYWQEYIWLNPGTYKLTCNVPTNSNLNAFSPAAIQGYITYTDYNEDALSKYTFIGGGVRIKRITNYGSNNNVSSSIKYSYVNEDGKTSGLLMIPTQNIDYKTIRVGTYYPDNSGFGGIGNTTLVDKPTYTLSGNSYVTLSTLPFGNKVGYSRVEVESDNSTGNNGKEISYFRNAPATILFNRIPYFGETANGNLEQKIIMNNNGDTLLVEKNTYGVLSGTKTAENINTYAEDLYQGADMCINLHDPFAYIGRFNIFTYPTINYWNTLTNKETIHYFANGQVKKTYAYSYNPNNFCVNSITESTSKGSKHTGIKYPADFTGTPIYDAMIAGNQISPVIEQAEYKEGSTKYNESTLSQSKRTNYTYFQNNTIISPTSVDLKIGSNTYETRLVYDTYDNKGNLQYLIKDGINKVVYLWGYNQSYPVAKIEGATLTEVSNALGGAIPNLGAGGLSDSQVANLRNQLTNAQVSTYTYSPLVGILTSTDPNGLTTYYEYDSLGRLRKSYLMENGSKKNIQSYDYNYANQ